MSLIRSKVLVVDDEASLRKALRTSLVASGFSVEEARSGEEALDALRQNPFDLVLLDINMPGINGFDACQRLRALSPSAGIVMVTVKDLEEDKIRALEAGADDYVTKPFRLRELTARLRAVLRRIQPQGNPMKVRAGELEIDFEARTLTRNGEEIHLAPKEFDLLAFMMKHIDAPLRHVTLLHSVWGPDYGNELEYLRAYVRILRKKLEKDPSQPEYILTEPWLGYRFRNPSDPDSSPISRDDD
jgi:two-component system, OmpR family, KDP operon response regulator KdpE